MKFYLRNILCLLNENACLPNPRSGGFTGKEYHLQFLHITGEADKPKGI